MFYCYKNFLIYILLVVLLIYMIRMFSRPHFNKDWNVYETSCLLLLLHCSCQSNFLCACHTVWNTLNYDGTINFSSDPLSSVASVSELIRVSVYSLLLILGAWSAVAPKILAFTFLYMMWMIWLSWAELSHGSNLSWYCL